LSRAKNNGSLTPSPPCKEFIFNFYNSIYSKQFYFLWASLGKYLKKIIQ
jgi:hypothetical protein